MDDLIQELLNDLRFGDSRAKQKALLKLGDVAKGQLDSVNQAIKDVMRTGDSSIEVLGAITLARLGDQSEPIISTLVEALEHEIDEKPIDSREEYIKVRNFSTIAKGLSYIRNDPKVVTVLLNAAKHDEISAVRDAAVFALGAIGDPTAKNFLHYQAQKGNTPAKVALEMFGKADYSTIDEAGSGTYVLKCSNCGYIGKFELTFLGKHRCIKCRKVGQGLPL